MQGFAALAGEEGVLSIDTPALLPVSAFPYAHASALAGALAELRAGDSKSTFQPVGSTAERSVEYEVRRAERESAVLGAVDAPALLAAAAAEGLVPRPGSGAVFSRWD